MLNFSYNLGYRFRARPVFFDEDTNPSEEELFELLKEKKLEIKRSGFTHRPDSHNQSVGRMNINGKPVFYCSDTDRVAVEEINKCKDTSRWFFISLWNGKNVTLNNLQDLYLPGCTRSPCVKYIGSNAKEFLRTSLETKEYSQEEINRYIVTMAEFGKFFENKSYDISASYAHHQIYTLATDGIRYPSVCTNGGGSNLALNINVAKDLKLERVYIARYLGDDTDDMYYTCMKAVPLGSGDLEWHMHKKIQSPYFERLLQNEVFTIDRDYQPN